MSGYNENFVKLVHVGRTAKVVKGGRRFSFCAVVVAGNQNGMVGLGTGKANEVVEAHEKAKNEALKRMVKIDLYDGRTIHHDVIGKFGSGYVKLKAAVPGTGIIAGGHIRPLLEALGIKDIVVKSFGSSNPHNVIKATLQGLTSTHAPKYIAAKRGIPTGMIVKRLKKRRSVDLKTQQNDNE